MAMEISRLTLSCVISLVSVFCFSTQNLICKFDSLVMSVLVRSNSCKLHFYNLIRHYKRSSYPISYFMLSDNSFHISNEKTVYLISCWVSSFLCAVIIFNSLHFCPCLLFHHQHPSSTMCWHFCPNIVVHFLFSSEWHFLWYIYVVS